MRKKKNQSKKLACMFCCEMEVEKTNNLFYIYIYMFQYLFTIINFWKNMNVNNAANYDDDVIITFYLFLMMMMKTMLLSFLKFFLLFKTLISLKLAFFFFYYLFSAVIPHTQIRSKKLDWTFLQQHVYAFSRSLFFIY